MKSNSTSFSNYKIKSILTSFVNQYGGISDEYFTDNDTVKTREQSKTYLIVGPKSGSILGAANSNVSNLKQAYSRTTSLVIHGNKRDQVDIRKLDISRNARVLINAHGRNSGGKHQITLYSSFGYDSGCDYTSYNFQAISQASKKQPVNVELFSCYGGAAINDITYLPLNSSLITFVSAQYVSFSAINHELITKSAEFRNPDNQFIRFASYILINANDTHFAMNSLEANHFFFSNISTLNDYSIDGIRGWQKKQLLNLLIL